MGSPICFYNVFTNLASKTIFYFYELCTLDKKEFMTSKHSVPRDDEYLKCKGDVNKISSPCAELRFIGSKIQITNKSEGSIWEKKFGILYYLLWRTYHDKQRSTGLVLAKVYEEEIG